MLAIRGKTGLANAKGFADGSGWVVARWCFWSPGDCGGPARSGRTTVNGRTAQEWFDHALERPMNVESACQALVRLGSAAVPVLARAFRAETGRPGSRWATIYPSLPAWIRKHVSAPVSARKRSQLALTILPELSREHQRAVARLVFDHYVGLVRDPANPDRLLLLNDYLRQMEPGIERFAALLVGLLDDGDPSIRNAAIRLIALTAHPRDGRGEHFRAAVPGLIPSLVPGAMTNREAALDALQAMGTAAQDAVPAIENLALEPGQFERAAFALWWIDRQTNRILPLVTNRLSADLGSIAVVADLGPAARWLVPELTNAITHPKIEIAFESVRAVAQIDPGQRPLVTATLLAWVNHPATPVDYVRRSIEQIAESEIDTPEVRDALERRLLHYDRAVRRASREALDRQDVVREMRASR